MKYFDFKEWFDEIKEKDYEYIKNLKYYGFKLVFYENSVVFEENNQIPKYPWSSDYKKLWIKEKNLEKWLFYQNKIIYHRYKKYLKRHSI